MLDEIMVKGTLDTGLLKGWEITNHPPMIQNVSYMKETKFGSLNNPMIIPGIAIRKPQQHKRKCFEHWGCSN